MTRDGWKRASFSACGASTLTVRGRRPGGGGGAGGGGGNGRAVVVVVVVVAAAVAGQDVSG